MPALKKAGAHITAMQKKYRIAILGIGGVGGFLGGKLAVAYSASADVEIIFIARGDNARTIKESGLKLITAAGEVIARPHEVVLDSDQIGALDVLICCTKAYDLESSVNSMASSITPDTIILPLLNGVDNTERVQLVCPSAKVLHGCIYLVSKLIAPGIVQQRGEFYSLHFGGDQALKKEMHALLDIFENANINAILEDNIHEKLWSKFSFISPVATYTSVYNISIGNILQSNRHTSSLKTLMTELATLAKTLRVNLPADSIENNFLVMEKLPSETTSSMHADFAGNKPTELETLTGYVIRKAAEKGLTLNSFLQMYQLLRERQ